MKSTNSLVVATRDRTSALEVNSENGPTNIIKVSPEVAVFRNGRVVGMVAYLVGRPAARVHHRSARLVQVATKREKIFGIYTIEEGWN